MQTHSWRVLDIAGGGNLLPGNDSIFLGEQDSTADH